VSDGRRTPEWSELSSLVDALLDAPPERRAALIAELSGDDAARRAELERLVADFDRDSPLLARPAAERFAALFVDPASSFPKLLAERYQLTREVARGGMATVYLARDLRHSRDVAVKVVHPIIAESLGIERFLHEIAVVAPLRHPHIVPLFDSGSVAAGGAGTNSGAASGGSVLYYVMPFEPGQSVRQRLARDGPLPVDDVITILRDVCDALAYAHERGIVHRDIKPDNVLLAGRHALVTDFGVAKALVSAPGGNERPEPTRAPAPSAVEGKDLPNVARTSFMATAGAAFGTPTYMAPEQIAADPTIDHRADIYAVGVLAYELLTGRPPFARDSRDALLAAHLTETPQSVTDRRQDVPPDLAALVMRCLAKDPAGRWQSANELVERLERLSSPERGASSPRARTLRWAVAGGALAGILAVVVVLSRQRNAAPDAWLARWSNAGIERLTDFPGSEVDAAISADGKLVAFLADRDSIFDAFVTRVGSGEFQNVTGGRFSQLLNEDVRNIGFDATGANLWLRVADLTSPANSVVSLMPTFGGQMRPLLTKSVMAAWSPDGSRIAYHETTGGDPIFIADRDGTHARRIHVGAPGNHCHHLSWSPDGHYIYFSSGIPPDEMDIWRVPVAGGPAERLTTHNSRVGYPSLLDDTTLVYVATADDGTGPWLYSMSLATRKRERVLSGVDHYISIAASRQIAGQPTRLVATVSNPTVGLWWVPIGAGGVAEDSAARVVVPTSRSAAPRFAPDGSLLYLASRSGADGIWRLGPNGSAEIWKPNDGAVAGAVGVSPDGRELCFAVRRNGRSTLQCMSADGTNAHSIASSLDVRGAPSWSPDGKWIAIGAKDGAAVRLYKVPVGGGEPVRLVDSLSSNPAWSPNGKFIVYSGTPRARSVPVKAVTPDGQAYPLPDLTVDRVGDSYRFLPDGKALVVKEGGFRRQNFSLVDLETGRRRQLTALRAGEQLLRFDVSPDGKRLVFERMRENSDIALITLPSS
jgi:serine/threonine protein kinase/Tol biopolymer transport system component